MKLSIAADWLTIDGRPVARFDTPHVGGRMTPSLIVLHETAGRLTRGSSVMWFMDATSKVSAHFVIERDGAITQLAACDRQTWHAGQSEWKGRKHVNGFGIGIEIVGPGKLVARGKDKAVAWFGEIFDVPSYRIEQRKTDQHGDGLWMPYTDEQMRAVEALIAALAAAYPSIKEVVGHFQISPGRKVDPNPLLPPGMLGPVRRPRLADPQVADISAAQDRLKALGYFPGATDGVLGPRTEAAIFAFQKQNDLKATGKLDAETTTAVAAEEAKPMPTATREWITETELAGASRTVDEQRSARSEGQLVAGLGVFTTLMTAFSGAGAALKQVVTDFGPEVVLVGLGGALAAYGVRAWRRANRTIGYRVEDAQTGAHVSAGGGS